MAYDLSKLLVVGISSTALFNLEEETRIFDSKGLSSFISYQREHEDENLKPGSAFPLVKGLLALNTKLGVRKVEVILMSKNHPDVSLRVFNSIRNHGLDMKRAALTGGAPLGPYLAPFGIGLFLSQDAADVQSAANQGVAAGLIYSPPPELDLPTGPIRIAFDGDCVIFSDEAQEVYEKKGLEAFSEYEEGNAKKELPAGPFAKLLRFLSEIQTPDPNTSPIRVALVTDRNMPTHERVIRTLRAWNVRMDEAFFLGGIPKHGILSAFGAHMFFDDKEEHCKSAADKVPTGQVFRPAKEHHEIELGVSVEVGVGDGGERSLLVICKSYLKRDYSANEAKLKRWYQEKILDWPEKNRSALLEELEESAKGTPQGDERRASAEVDTPESKLMAFLENLALKHRPK